MSVFMIWTYVVKSEGQGEFMSLVQKLTEYAKENPKKFEEVKSWKFFTQMFGGVSGGYVDMIEFENMTELEEWRSRMWFKDEGCMKMVQEFMLLIDPATFSISVWNEIT